MDGVRTAAGWVRELQGRWLGSLGSIGGRRTVFSRRIVPLWPSAGVAMRGMAREYAAEPVSEVRGTRAWSHYVTHRI